MAGYIPAFWLSRYKTAVLTLRLSSEERDMSDAPERIWHTTDRKGKIYGATDAHVEPCKSVARHYVEYIRADLSPQPKVKPLDDAAISRARTIIINESGGYWHPDNRMVRRILSALE